MLRAPQDHARLIDYGMTMKKKELYRQLIDTAAKLGITVSEQNFRATNVRANSGLCHIKGEAVFIMDKHLPVAEKAETLAACLRTMDTDGIYIMPAVRKYLDPSA